MLQAFLGGSDSKESVCNAGDPASIPGLGRSSGEGNGNPLQYSCLKNSMDRGAWQATVHRVAKLDTTERLILSFSQLTYRLPRSRANHLVGGQGVEASLIAQLVKNPPAVQETPVWFLGWKDPLEKGQATHSSILGLPLWLNW